MSDVIILAADLVGPFVVQGFNGLHLLTTDGNRPFSEDRNGLQLGEAAAAVVVSSSPGPLRVRGVGLDAEGFAVTRPSQAGRSLKQACEMIPELREKPPELVIAHGTGTLLNDSIEDQVFSEIFADVEKKPLITCTKWSVGHTLGASGAIDFIAACEALKRQETFTIAKTEKADPLFKCQYLTSGTRSELSRPLKSVLVSSLGFGGVHAALLLDRQDKRQDKRQDIGS